MGLLDDGGWLRGGFILNETDRKIMLQADVDAKALIIRVPYHLHRNLTSLLDKLFIGGKGKVVWTSTDGCVSAGVIVDGKETAYDLCRWAAETLKAGAPPDPDMDLATHIRWLRKVERAFFAVQETS